ncbi:MAG: UDP-N-acetylglucosamine--N-acetylmuramyl-(pentapeptide) pyrophosphoryl-undecaprenol N-acetylglucosamine transferase [Clostridia bacterium]|nr:UDP-N-acetylglucosamine--N-acetylmuramyl-(pentapeptide) pyrophosphoryl-undecaprenol N-acetylglucosamine transferase [Clostridia bacterium]
MKKIVLTGGGTAGHVTPNLAILPYLKKHFNEIYYIGSTNGIEEKLVKDKKVTFYGINPTKLIRGFNLKNLLIFYKLLKSVNDAKKILSDIKPNVVFSKGGFVGLPVTIAAKKLKIPVVIHESDLTLGLANKISTNYADKLLTTFLETAKGRKNAEFVGAIVRDELFTVTKLEGLRYYGFSGKKPIILVTGGSQGARAINNAIISILPNLLKDYNVLHLVGKNNLTNVEFEGYKQVEFTDMKYAYACCDYAVSRAGSNTAFELITLNIPTLFIPLPKGNSRGDQVDNAKFFTKKGLCYTLFEQDITPKNLQNAILNLVLNEKEIKQNIINLKYPVANSKIIKILNKY